MSSDSLLHIVRIFFLPPSSSFVAFSNRLHPFFCLFFFIFLLLLVLLHCFVFPFYWTMRYNRNINPRIFITELIITRCWHNGFASAYKVVHSSLQLAQDSPISKECHLRILPRSQSSSSSSFSSCPRLYCSCLRQVPTALWNYKPPGLIIKR